MDYSQSEVFKAQAQVWKWALSYITSMSIKCAIELGIPDLINKHNPPSTSLPQLISVLNIPPSKTQAFACMMRILSTRSAGFFSLQRRHEEEVEVYSLTPASKLLLEGKINPTTLPQTSVILLHLHPVMRDHFSILSTWLLDDDPPEVADPGEASFRVRNQFEHANGMSFWDYLASTSRPMGRQLKGLFYDCMSSDSKLVADALVSEEYSDLLFRGVDSFLDVAGGTGMLASIVAQAFPNIKCVVLDLPHVVAQQQGVYPVNLEFVGGDMFNNIPSADAIMLKWILHNWDDERCVRILKSCKEAVSRDEKKKGKVIIIDMVVDQNQEDLCYEVQLHFDLLMMTAYNGKEETGRSYSTRPGLATTP
ncbi:Probable O-methyltransferase 3 [Linum grandiflorum]